MPRKRSGRILKTIRPELKSLALQLRNARTKAVLTQDEVAEKLEVTAQTVRNWEVGRSEPSATHKQALSRIYGIQTAELVGLNNRKGLTAVAPFTRVVADPERLKIARQRSGLRQRQAANQSGMSPETLGRYERGIATPSKANLESLAATYGVPAEWLIRGTSIHTRDETDSSTDDSRPERPGLRGDKVTDAYRLAQPDLSGDDVNSIADFILFLHDRHSTDTVDAGSVPISRKADSDLSPPPSTTRPHASVSTNRPWSAFPPPNHAAKPNQDL